MSTFVPFQRKPALFSWLAPIAGVALALAGILAAPPLRALGKAESDPAPALPVVARLLKLSVTGDGKAMVTPDPKAFHADIQIVTDKVSDIQAYQNAIPLKEGATYTLKYRAKASVPRGLGVALKLDQGDFHPLCRVDGISLSTEWREFTKVFQAKGTEPDHSRIEFDLGGQAGAVWLSDIRLTPGATALKPGKSLLAPITDFSGWDISLFGRLTTTSEWQPGTGGIIALTAEGSAAKVMVSQRSSPETCWAALIGHPNLKENTVYVLHFRARAEPARDIWVWGEQENITAHHNGLDFHAAATPEWKDFTTTFTTKPGMTGQNLVPEFQVSNRTGIVWFSDVTLSEAAPAGAAGDPPVSPRVTDASPNVSPALDNTTQQDVRSVIARTPEAATSGLPALTSDLIRQALAAAESISDSGAKVRALCAIARTRAQAGDGAGARQSFQAATQNANQLTDIEAAISALREIGTAQALANETTAARQTFEDAKQKIEKIVGEEPRTRALGVTAAAQAGAGFSTDADLTFALAAQTARKISKAVPRTLVLAALSKNQARCGNLAAAMALAREARRASDEIQEGDANNSRYWRDRTRGTEVVGALAFAGDTAGATILADGISDTYMKSSALWGLASAQAETKDMEAALTTAGQISDAYIKSRAFLSIETAQANSGDIVGAKQTNGRILEPNLKDAGSLILAVAQAKSGDIAAAIQTTHQISDKNSISEALSEIAVAQSRAGDTGAAKQSTRQIADFYWQAVTLSHSAGVMLKSVRLATTGNPVITNVSPIASSPADNMLKPVTDPAGWTLFTAKPAAGASAVEEDALKVVTGQAGSASWQVQVRQVVFGIEEGKRYVMTGRVRADRTRPVGIYFTTESNSKRDIGLGQVPKATTDWKSFRYVFLARGAVGEKCILELMSGDIEGTIWWSNLDMRPETSAEATQREAWAEASALKGRWPLDQYRTYAEIPSIRRRFLIAPLRFANTRDRYVEKKEFFDGLFSSEWPGMGHYWRSLSYGKVHVEGVAVDWIDLPGNWQDYCYTKNRIEKPGDVLNDVKMFDLQKLANEVARRYSMRDFDAIALFPNIRDGSSYAFAVTVTMQGRVYPGIFVPDSGIKLMVVAHEMGHAFGFGHPYGPATKPFNDHWDMMGSGGSYGNRHLRLGAIPGETNAYHKMKAGWISEPQIMRMGPGMEKEFHLERIAEPTRKTYLAAIIAPTNAGRLFWTLEARMNVGYELGCIPREGVVMHYCDPMREDPVYPSLHVPAVTSPVNTENNDDLNGEGVAWEAGKTYVNAQYHFSVTVVSRDATGWTVRVKVDP